MKHVDLCFEGHAKRILEMNKSPADGGVKSSEVGKHENVAGAIGTVLWISPESLNSSEVKVESKWQC